MYFRQFSRVGRLRRIMVFLLLTLLVVCGEKEESSVVGFHKQPSSMAGQNQQHQRPRQPLAVYFSGKRKVPNASDPLHNR
ncbi:hypothetical protein L6164_024606 [Bauhinia variegata]|uniref:Uncharacterized protein n=1 Tax=Bauhinia variegata TaxID=167791 RepID=A0ACB9LZ98_BAUVA|nr:hypothetical protein L6164_024606 [Bauhinia variegata]